MRLRRILAAYGTSLLGIFSGLLSSLWLLKDITVYVSKSEFGVYAYIIQIAAYLSVLQLGLDFAVSRQIADYLGKEQHTNANKSYWELRRYNNLGFLIVPAIVAILSLLINYGLLIKSGFDRQLAVLLLILGGVVQLLYFLERPNTAALIGSRRQSNVNLINVGRAIGSTLLSILLLNLTRQIYFILIAEIFSHVVSYLLLNYQIRKYCAWYEEKKPERYPDIAKELFKFGGVSTLGGIAWTLESTSDVIILGAFGGTNLIAYYVLWWRFPSMLFTLCTQLASSAFPEFAESNSVSKEELKTILSKIMFISLFLGGLVFLGVSLWLNDFIKIWFGNSYSLPYGTVLAIMMGTLVLTRVIGNLFSMLWLSRGDASLTTTLAWLQAFVKIAIGIVLISSFDIIGLLVASIVAGMIQVIGMSSYLLKENLISRDSIYYASVVLLAAIILITSYYYAINMAIQNLYILFIAMLLTLIIWLFMYLLIAKYSNFKIYVSSLKNMIYKIVSSGNTGYDSTNTLH